MMRGASARQRRHEEEEESVFVSMTDMTVGFLFIVILLLAFFASQYDPSEMVPRVDYERVLDERNALAQELAQTQEQLAQASAQIEQLRTELDKVKTERDAAQREVAELDTKIAELMRRIEDLESQVSRLEVRIAELEAELENLRRPNPLEAYINNSMEARRTILERLRDLIKLDFPDLQLVLSEESLRFQGEGLFQRAQSTLRPERLQLVESVATRLQEILPCYTLGAGADFSSSCNAGFALIEAVQIEGHTDSDGDDMSNLVLSTNRATNTFRAMTEHRPSLVSYLNFQQQPVLSVAGYGRMRPVAGNDTMENKASNRRIDLRIIMHVPRDTDEIQKVRDNFMLGARMTP